MNKTRQIIAIICRVISAWLRPWTLSPMQLRALVHAKTQRGVPMTPTIEKTILDMDTRIAWEKIVSKELFDIDIATSPEMYRTDNISRFS